MDCKLILLLCCIGAQAQIISPIFFQGPAATATCGGSGFTTCKTITLLSSRVPNTDQTNFPVLISGTYSYLAVTGSGGSVQHSGTCYATTTNVACPFDVIITSDSACTTKMNWEVESWTSTTGAIVYWVNVPTLSHSSDTLIYLCAGKSSVSTDQSAQTATWNANFLLTVHEPNGSSLTLADSSPSAFGITNSSSTATAGKIDGAAAFVGASSQSWNTTPGVYPQKATITASAWINPTSTSGVQTVIDVDKASGQAYSIALNGSNLYCRGFSGGSFHTAQDAGSTTANVWTHVACTYDGTTLRLYKNGSSVASVAYAIDYTNSKNLFVGTNFNSGAKTEFFTGAIDEVEGLGCTSGCAMSADWIAAEYNNQSSPSTFYTIQ